MRRMMEEFDGKKPLRIYECEDSMEGILSAVYEAGISGYGHKYIRIAPKRQGESESMTLFAEYVAVETNSEYADVVLDKVRSGISTEAYQYVLHALASDKPERADIVYQFVAYGFTLGAKITKALQIPCVKAMFALERKVKNEAMWFREFVRFQQVSEEPSVLLAVIEPEARIISMIAPHFADRLNPERFVIYDKSHGEAVFHMPGEPWFIRLLSTEEAESLEQMWEQQEKYVELWKTFFHSICIEERKNKNLQRNMARLKYRKHMTEFME
ncbi:MAG: TIGR03915 family putative DNA repair protein [Lachnospiraceae bacterium]|nr:TIGR03915 family putative DNA repair protein [Lachnospiraceae bacterium]